MQLDSSLLGYFWHASLVVKLVMLILLSASFVSWVLIFQRGQFIRDSRRRFNSFETHFWSLNDLGQLYRELEEKKEKVEGLEKIFFSGFKEFARLTKKSSIDSEGIMEGVQRAMRVSHAHAADELENHLSFLATVGSTSPYVGLFGTVWGIMTAFQALGHVSQASIAMVAPGISEALIATAMGLFAAIPAVIAYNRYSNMVERLLNRYEAFQEEFLNYLYRQAQLYKKEGA